MQIMVKQYRWHLPLVIYCLFIKLLCLKEALYGERWFFSILLESIIFLNIKSHNLKATVLNEENIEFISGFVDNGSIHTTLI